MQHRRDLLVGLAAGMMLMSAPALALPEPSNGRIRRRYVEGPFGQLHMRVATPPRGAPVSAPPLLLLHQSPLSGRMFDRLMPLLADRRIVLAVDTPGYGESDRPPERPSLAGYSDAILYALRQAFGQRLDVAGYHTGAAIAADMAARHPRRIRKLVLIAVPHFDDARRGDLLKQLGQKAVYKDDGSHLLPLWTGSFKARPQGQSVDHVARIVAEKQRVGQFGEWALLSALAENLAPVFSRIAQPTFLLAPHDGLEDETRAAAKLIRNASVQELPSFAYGLFDAAPAEIAGHVLRFLGR
jgi:pimeloyl-ACP methyl ester carboxylesterase